jgi:hypothetical protein
LASTEGDRFVNDEWRQSVPVLLKQDVQNFRGHAVNGAIDLYRDLAVEEVCFLQEKRRYEPPARDENV